MQVPASFDYARAGSVEEAIGLLEQHGEDARLIAGGHSLLPMMKLRLAAPAFLVDINDLTDLARIVVDGDVLRIGAMVRHAELLASPVVGEHFRILHDAERVIADPIVRNRGTVGGSLCHADPAEDLSAVLAAISAEVVVRGSSGERTIAVRELADGPFQTVLEPAEILTEITVPIRGGAGSAYAKVHRCTGDYAVAAAGAIVWLDGDTISDAGIALASVGAPHNVGAATEDAIRGRAADDVTLELAGTTASQECNPHTDQRGPAEALEALASGAPRLLRISPTPDEIVRPDVISRHNPCRSGGALEIFLEPSVPLPAVLVFGAAPIATALLRADRLFGQSVRALATADGTLPPGTTAVVVASHGNDEAPVLEAALRAGVPYVGLVASRRRGAAVLDSLDIDDDLRKRVHTPAGLDISARTPPEVALSILAEIVDVLREPSPSVAPAPASQATETAIDPVCGMRVAAVEASVHVDTPAGRVYFCGPGCRDAYRDNPAAYPA